MRRIISLHGFRPTDAPGPPGFLRAAILVLAAAAAMAVSAQDTFETPPVLQAAELVDESLLQGPHHRVDEQARNDGMMNHFTIRSDFGDFEAESEELLEIRVREVSALAKLAEISRTEAFADALKRSIARPVSAVKQVATDPVGTMKGLPEGLNKRFKGLYYKAKKTGRKVKEEVQEEFADEEPSADAGETEAGEAEAGEASSGTEQTIDTVKKFAGWESAKRQLAQGLGIDPYSTNPVLQAELERLASAAFTGGLTFKLAAPSVGGLSLVEDVNDMVWTTPPGELERLNDKALKDMGIDAGARFAFFDNPRLTPSLETRLVAALKRMSPAADRGVLIDLAASAETELEARFFAGAADMLASYHTGVGPLRELLAAGNDEIGRILVAIAGDGSAVVAAPVDYLIWQPGMAGGALSGYPKRELWLAGSVSPRARKELSARGWTVKTDVDFGS